MLAIGTPTMKSNLSNSLKAHIHQQLKQQPYLLRRLLDHVEDQVRDFDRLLGGAAHSTHNNHPRVWDVLEHQLGHRTDPVRTGHACSTVLVDFPVATSREFFSSSSGCICSYCIYANDRLARYCPTA